VNRSAVEQVLERKDPGRFVYAPNYWQWFAHHRNHGLLPPELANAGDQLGMIEHLGLDIFSRNIYCNEQDGWFGGLTRPTWPEELQLKEQRYTDGQDIITERTWTTPAGELDERLRYVWSESTLVQEAFLLGDYDEQAEAFEFWLKNRRCQFKADFCKEQSARMPEGAVICAGEVTSPLKMLHMLLGPEQAVFLLMDEPEMAARWMKLHHDQQLAVMREMLKGGVRSVMAMDNLDTQFHPPHYVEQYSAAFYEEAAALCHQYGATFWIHACGRQKQNLELISSLGVDGLEGVAFPPTGDITLPDAFALSGDRFLITGGISAIQFKQLQSREAVFAYTQDLLQSLREFRHRFMLAPSCNTPINARWEQILWFRDAWREFA
jgi:hypothetical protein